jgi:transcriptional regulator with XRE-family HTH domain
MSTKEQRVTRSKRLSKLLNKVMDIYDLNQRELAEALNVNAKTLSAWVRCKWHPQSDEEYNRITQDLKYFLRKVESSKPTLPQVPEVGEIIPKVAGEDPLTEQQELPLSSALDVQVGGNHYKDSCIQPIQYIEANKLGFLEGCIIKRATRHNRDSGKGLEDLQKIIHEAQLLIELRYRDGV